MRNFSYGMWHLRLAIVVGFLIGTLLFSSGLKLQKEQFILSAEILTLILLAIGFCIAQLGWRRVKELEAINQELQKEIGDRKQVLDELSKSKHKYQSLVNWIDGIVWEADAQTKQFTFVSQKAERLLGYPVKTWFEEANFWKNHIHPDDREQVLNFCHQNIQSKKEYDLEYRTIAADGRVVWLRNIVTVITESDRPVKIQGVMVDITAQKHAETALRASEERYRRIIETANEGIWVLDSQNQTIFANKKMAEMLGYNLQEMLGMPLFAFTDEENQASAAAKMEHRRQCIQEQYDFKFRRKDGSDLWTMVSATPICDRDGQYMGTLGMIADITERKQAEADLQESEEKYRLLFSNELDAIILFDIETGLFLDVNNSFLQMYGYSKEEALKLTPADVSAEVENTYSAINKASITGSAHIFIRWHKKKDGTVFPVELCAGTFIWKSRKVMCSAIRDITQRRQVEEALLQSEARLRLALEAARMGTWDWNILTNEVMYSEQLRQMFGLPPGSDRLTQEAFLDAVHPEDRKYVLQTIARALGKGVEYALEFRVISPDGIVYWIGNKGQVYYDENGKPIRTIGVAMDITSRKQAEADLRESEERWQLALRGNNDGIWDWNVKTNEVFFSTRWKSMLGYEDWEIANHLDEWEKRVYPEDIDSATAAIKDHFAKKTPFYISEHRVLCKDGTYKWILDRGQALWDREGNPIRMTGSHTDITERKRAEEELRWKAALLRSMTAASPLAFYVVDNRNGAILYFNHRFCEIWGIEHLEEQMQRGELKSNDIIAHCLPVLLDVQAFTEFCKPLQSEENRAVVEDEIAFIDGRIIRRFSAQIRDESDRYFGHLYIFEDVTQRKQIEEALYQANEQLKASVDRLEQRNQEIVQLGELSDVLQACLTVEEAYSAIAKLVQPLFPNMAGGIFITSPSRKLVEMVASWGTSLVSQQMFAPNECWALRRGREHSVTDAHSGLLCKHIHSHPAESLCVPMMAQGEAIGMLHLSTQAEGQLTQAKQILARTVSEHIAMALANLKLRETLQHQSIRDVLTGLFNRRYLEESLEREIHRAKRKQQSLGIIMLDVDHFKQFNDTFGHDAGDAVLRELGLLLQKQIRASDIACRYGGEELTVILPETSLEDTRKRAEQLRLAVKHLSVQHHGQLLGAITLSLGVAVFPDCGNTGEEIIQAADAALYRAKKQGRDRVVTAV
ncbi:PAS domain S-box protein [Aerosakkonema sp. BLCC-F183]|uniref:PAS domain S-box protein n=1 Tax=Aerosakkonema sp. BLCC-F183 TaxID=3342834 RepID=UPI0035B8B069